MKYFYVITAAASLALFSGPVSAQRQRRGPEPPAEDVGAESASHRELEPLAIEFETITALRLLPDGDLLAADGPAKVIKIISPTGKQVGAIKLAFGPEAVDVAADGTIYCGGQGKLATVTKRGEVLASVDVPGDVGTAVGATSRRRARGRPTRISGIAVTGKDVFVAFGSGWSMGSKSKLYRFGLNWDKPRLLAQGLRGCCQRCDIVARDGVLYLAENAAHRVVAYDRDGKVLAKWGTRSRTGLEGFGSCCNPMNLNFDSKGVLYTAESGLGRVKKHSTDGKFLGLVGYIGVERFTRAGGLAASCSNIAIAVTPDAKRVYVLDFKKSLIRVMEKKG